MICIVGAGALGLAIARRLSARGKEVILLERNHAIGQGTSSRNSEVIHAGIYYHPNSLKARSCVHGRKLLYRFCEDYNIPHRRCGKLIVATNEAEEPRLKELLNRSVANGLNTPEDRLQWIQGRQACQELEPELNATAALYSPSTGIFDSHSYMLALQGDAERDGSSIAFNYEFLDAVVTGNSRRMVVRAQPTTLASSSPPDLPFPDSSLSDSSSSDSSSSDSVSTSVSTSTASAKTIEEIECTTLINCAGLSAPYVASRIFSDVDVGVGVDVDDDSCGKNTDPSNNMFPVCSPPPPYYCKGSYFQLSGQKSPFEHLIYPAPNDSGLGVHLTFDLGGQARFGPDTEWVNDPSDLNVDSSRAMDFYSEVRKYWPSLKDGTLQPDYCGIRPKIAPQGSPSDFTIEFRTFSKQDINIVNLYGIESPGLTSSLWLADYVSGLVTSN